MDKKKIEKSKKTYIDIKKILDENPFFFVF